MRISRSLVTGAVALVAAPSLALAAPKPTTTDNAAPAANAPAAAPATTAPSGTTAGPTANSPAAATPAAGAAGNVVVGATVKDTNGGTVGTIESVDGQYAVLSTGKSKVRLPLTSFGKGAEGPVLAMTQAQVDAAASAAAKTGAP